MLLVEKDVYLVNKFNNNVLQLYYEEGSNEIDLMSDDLTINSFPKNHEVNYLGEGICELDDVKYYMRSFITFKP